MENKIKEKIIWRRMETPCGVLRIGSSRESLCLCDWEYRVNRRMVEGRLYRLLGAEFEEGTTPIIEFAITQLGEYFKGKRKSFDLPPLTVGTDFQKEVWRALAEIPYGKTITYGELATKIGRPDAVRGVANAVGANAMSIIIPCHRVIGIDRRLTGYAGGLDAKEYLLRLESGD